MWNVPGLTYVDFFPLNLGLNLDIFRFTTESLLVIRAVHWKNTIRNLMTIRHWVHCDSHNYVPKVISHAPFLSISIRIYPECQRLFRSRNNFLRVWNEALSKFSPSFFVGCITRKGTSGIRVTRSWWFYKERSVSCKEWHFTNIVFVRCTMPDRPSTSTHLSDRAFRWVNVWNLVIAIILQQIVG